MMRELKGAESAQMFFETNSAAAQIPMMRELKAFWGGGVVYTKSCCSPNPYDEGTERFNKATQNASQGKLQPKSL